MTNRSMYVRPFGSLPQCRFFIVVIAVFEMIDHGDHETLHVIKGGFFLFAVVHASKAP